MSDNEDNNNATEEFNPTMADLIKYANADGSWTVQGHALNIRQKKAIRAFALCQTHELIPTQVTLDEIATKQATIETAYNGQVRQLHNQLQQVQEQLIRRDAALQQKQYQRGLAESVAHHAQQAVQQVHFQLQQQQQANANPQPIPGSTSEAAKTANKTCLDSLVKYKGTCNALAIMDLEQGLDDLFSLNPNFSEAQKLVIAYRQLEDSGQTWIRKKRQEGDNNHFLAITTFTDFKRKLRNEFWPVDAIKKARLALIHLQQRTSFDDYNTRFQKLVMQIPDITESEKLDKFRNGLKSDVVLQLDLNPALEGADFNTYSRAASRADYILSSRNHRSNNNTTTYRATTMATITTCKAMATAARPISITIMLKPPTTKPRTRS